MKGRILRIIDANCNRAREALRVVEDVARFVLDDATIQASLKQIRHDLADAVSAFQSAAIAWRDTAGDVGTQTSTDTEQSRDDMSHVARANAARVGEALRAIEEALKTLDPVAAKAVESIRYRFYDIEHALLLSLRPAGRMERVRLCVLITESLCRRSWQETARLAIDGGADCLQLREKDLPAGELLARAREFVAICRERGIVSIINDRPDIALLAGADGVHVGQGDLPTLEARRLVGESMIVGTSTHSLAQARQAKRDGADYVGIGPVFRSPTKPRDFVVSRQELCDVARLPGLPALAIAGIDASNLQAVLDTGLRRIAVTAAVIASDDPAGAARLLRARLTSDDV